MIVDARRHHDSLIPVRLRVGGGIEIQLLDRGIVFLRPQRGGVRDLFVHRLAVETNTELPVGGTEVVIAHEAALDQLLALGRRQELPGERCLGVTDRYLVVLPAEVLHVGILERDLVVVVGLAEIELDLAQPVFGHGGLDVGAQAAEQQFVGTGPAGRVAAEVLELDAAAELDFLLVLLVDDNTGAHGASHPSEEHCGRDQRADDGLHRFLLVCVF